MMVYSATATSFSNSLHCFSGGTASAMTPASMLAQQCLSNPNQFLLRGNLTLLLEDEAKETMQSAHAVCNFTSKNREVHEASELIC